MREAVPGLALGMGTEMGMGRKYEGMRRRIWGLGGSIGGGFLGRGGVAASGGEWSGLWLGGEGGCWERVCSFEGVVDLGRVID